MKKKQRRKLLLIIAAAVLVIFAGLFALIAVVYKFDSSNHFVVAMEKHLPLPAVYLKGSGFISVGEVKEDAASVRKFYESQDFDQIGVRIDFGTDQGQKRLKIKEKEVIAKLIENKLIESLAKKRGISVTDSDVEAEVKKSSDQFGNEQKLMSELARLYSWTLEDFKNKVIIPELYSQKLSESYVSEINTSAQTKKISDLLARVTTKKEDFAKVASENSEGTSAASGGDLGWSNKDQLISEIADKAFTMKAGEISGVIESPLGFHIVKLEETKSENGENLVHLRQIFVKKITFGDWLHNQIKENKIVIFLKDYEWNQANGEIEFKDAGLRDFEKNTDINSQGDASVF